LGTCFDYAQHERVPGGSDHIRGSESVAVTATTTRRPRPAALDLTPSAHARIADLMARAPEGTVGVKLSTPKRGCSGLAYSVDYVASADPMDERIETPGGDLYVDAGSVLYLIGSRMDWVEDDFTAGFVFQNPNAKGACGCGESFTV
jgi:iron-sulfur cluster assembly protein